MTASVSRLKMPIRIRKRRNIMLTAKSMAEAYSGASSAELSRLLRARTEMVAVLL